MSEESKSKSKLTQLDKILITIALVAAMICATIISVKAINVKKAGGQSSPAATEKADEDNQEKKTTDSAKTQETVEVAKSSKPKVEAFVMSYCPYGTQIEKGLLPVLETLGNKIDFELKFVNYAMHDKKEMDENLRQYCIQKEEPAKFLGYLECFLADGNSEACLNSQKISGAKLSSCVSAADQEFGVTADYQNKEGWLSGRYPRFRVNDKENKEYGVKGSPALVVNGTLVKSGRDPQSLLDTICQGFEKKPAECDKELSTDRPSAGFGKGTASSGSGGCAS